jgi:hypothetical protein
MEKLDVNGMAPFYSHPDGATDRLKEAHALLTIFAAAFRETGDECIATTNPKIIAAAIDGVASLVALGLFHDSCVKAQEVRRG